MEDFQGLLEAYSFPKSYGRTKGYLKNYWLSKNEYLEKWESIQSKIFSLNTAFPEMVFRSGLIILARKGGVLFEKTDFELLQECLSMTKDRFIFIIEDYDEVHPPHDSGPGLRFKYPFDIRWDEMNIEEGLSYELFKRPIRNYYVFGDSGKWGKYVANDSKFPLEIFGFHKDYESIFFEKFKNSKKEMKELVGWLPDPYITI